MEILHNNPGDGHRPIKAAFEQAVGDATSRLYVINPYLADHAILRGLIEAAKRGVDVRVIVPADPHSLPASGAVRHWFRALREAGADVREHPEMAHAKVVLSDDTVLAGTANLDALSLRQNWELQLRIEDAAVADHFARELFDRDVEIATEATMPSRLARPGGERGDVGDLAAPLTRGPCGRARGRHPVPFADPPAGTRSSEPASGWRCMSGQSPRHSGCGRKRRLAPFGRALARPAPSNSVRLAGGARRRAAPAVCATVLLAAGAVYGDVVALGGLRQAILDAPPRAPRRRRRLDGRAGRRRCDR